MTNVGEAAVLNEILDRIWKSPTNRREIASEGISNLTDEDWLLIAAWDCAALFGPARGHFQVQLPSTFVVKDGLGETSFSGKLSREEAVDNRVLQFKGTGWSVFCPGVANSLNHDSEHDPTSLLVALQLIRDHLDSTLLKPHEIREAELREMAVTSGLELEQFRRLALWCPELMRHLGF